MTTHISNMTLDSKEQLKIQIAIHREQALMASIELSNLRADTFEKYIKTL